MAHCLLYDSGIEAVRSPRAEAAGEQGSIMIPCSLIEKVMKLAISPSRKSLEVMRLMKVLRVLGLQKEVP